jgi:hypothetical protein
MKSFGGDKRTSRDAGRFFCADHLAHDESSCPGGDRKHLEDVRRGGSRWSNQHAHDDTIKVLHLLPRQHETKRCAQQRHTINECVDRVSGCPFRRTSSAPPCCALTHLSLIAHRRTRSIQGPGMTVDSQASMHRSGGCCSRLDSGMHCKSRTRQINNEYGVCPPAILSGRRQRAQVSIIPQREFKGGH